MNPRILLSTSLALIFLSACSSSQAATPASPTATPAPTDTPLPTATMTATATFVPQPSPVAPPTNWLPVSHPAPSEVGLDFAALMCDAQWSNSGEYLPCPAAPEDLEGGSVGLVENPRIEGNFSVELPALLAIPAHDGSYRGIFGRYPPFTVQQGDVFHAILACQQDPSRCNVSFDLLYYDSQGRLHEFPTDTSHPLFAVNDAFGASHVFVSIPLDALSGQRVEFVLTTRDREAPLGSRALWVYPYIWRDPEYTPPTPPGSQLPTAQPPQPSGSAPGVISGLVDMTTAPPYLLDPIVHPQGKPVVVMFFNTTTGAWWWIHTTLTHPSYQMTVPPGKYKVVAYAQGIGDIPYVTAGYTGMNPSCGEKLKIVTVPPNTTVSGIDIADWNWTCGGTAFRPPKPGEVPLP